MATKKGSAFEVLRAAIDSSGLSQYRISNETDLERAFDFLDLEFRPASRR